MRLETLAVHAGHEADPTTGSVASPIYLSTNFARDPDGFLIEVLEWIEVERKHHHR